MAAAKGTNGWSPAKAKADEGRERARAKCRVDGFDA
jgi:hypothetical protein